MFDTVSDTGLSAGRRYVVLVLLVKDQLSRTSPILTVRCRKPRVCSPHDPAGPALWQLCPTKDRRISSTTPDLDESTDQVHDGMENQRGSFVRSAPIRQCAYHGKPWLEKLDAPEQRNAIREGRLTSR